MSILVVGDSFSQPRSNMTVWPVLLGQRLGKTVYNHAVGSAGYVAIGLPYANPQRFSRQLLWHPEFAYSEIELVIVFGSINDRWMIGDFYRSVVYATHRDLALTYPQAKQLVVMPQWSGPNPKPSESDSMRQMIADAMWGYDWKYPYLDPNPSNGTPFDYSNWWFPPNRPELWDTDLFHPNNAGHVLIADKIEPHARTLLGLPQRTV